MRLRWAPLPLLAVALVLAGCGGSSKKAAVTITSGTSTKVETVSVGGSSGDCKQLAALGSKLSSALASTNSANAKDPAGAAEAAAKAFKDFADQAPSSVRADFETFAKAFQGYADALKGIHFTPGKVPSSGDLKKMTDAVKRLTTPDLQRAEQHLQAWGQKNCKGISFGSTTP